MKATPEDADRATIEFVRRLIVELGLKMGLGNYGVNASQIDALSEQAFADGCHLTNPVPVTREDLKALYQAAL